VTQGRKNFQIFENLCQISKNRFFSLQIEKPLTNSNSST